MIFIPSLNPAALPWSELRWVGCSCSAGNTDFLGSKLLRGMRLNYMSGFLDEVFYYGQVGRLFHCLFPKPSAWEGSLLTWAYPGSTTGIEAAAEWVTCTF